jgi:4-hydroxybenzoate polyprenyltransferase
LALRRTFPSSWSAAPDNTHNKGVRVNLETARAGSPLRKAGVADYVAIMRLDHVTKHVFVVPGIILAILLRGSQVHLTLWPFFAGALVAVSIASANYVINEWLDREFDALHPTKSMRTAVKAELDGSVVWALWGVLVAFGLGMAASASSTMFYTALIFAAQGIVYNVKPFRSKDYAYIDVLTESINNPLRLLIGWAMVDPTTLPPASILIGYWLGGAFLMGAKRLSEYREIVASHGRELLVRYRASFAGYDEFKLASSCLVYALLSGMALAIFFVKYRIEYILVLPVIAILFGQYLALSMRPASTAQKPEKLFQERSLMLIVGVLVVVFAIATVVNIPLMDTLTTQSYIQLQ